MSYRSKWLLAVAALYLAGLALQAGEQSKKIKRLERRLEQRLEQRHSPAPESSMEEFFREANERHAKEAKESEAAYDRLLQEQQLQALRELQDSQR